MSHSGSPLVVGVPDCARLGMDQVGVMQISVCLVGPAGVTAFWKPRTPPCAARCRRGASFVF